ncbi:MAG: hypothetical protein ACLRX6_06025 [Limosilactobacillus pontis]|uniref:hypothetical protein n=1 Tax=Limosilactobacillus pontis TaxID=35787 RepID=UPI0011B09246|nr:hypothetical protein [Limosilactobacillus pontis]
MNYQILLASLAGLGVLLFLVQWIRQTRHALHGGTRPLAKTHPTLNWCLLLVAILAGAGASVSNMQTEAATSQAAESSSVKAQRAARASSSSASSASASSVAKEAAANNNRQGEQKMDELPTPDHQNIKLDQNGRAVLNNFAVPAKNQLQIIDAGSGNVLQTFSAQPNAGAVNYTFTKVGNYYLILTDGQQTKTIVLNVSR